MQNKITAIFATFHFFFRNFAATQGVFEFGKKNKEKCKKMCKSLRNCAFLSIPDIKNTLFASYFHDHAATTLCVGLFHHPSLIKNGSIICIKNLFNCFPTSLFVRAIFAVSPIYCIFAAKNRIQPS